MAGERSLEAVEKKLRQVGVGKIRQPLPTRILGPEHAAVGGPGGDPGDNAGNPSGATFAKYGVGHT